jgi:hypothetical protein
MSVVKNNSQSYVNPRVLPGQLLASGRSRSSRDYQSAIKSKFELEYIDASGNIKKENTFVYAIYQMARSSISASDKVKGINLLLEKERMEGKVLEDAEIAFIGKARSFISEVKASSVLRQKDAKLFHWVNTFVVQRPIKAKPTLYFPSLPNWLATPARVVAVAVAVAATALTLIALSGIENKAFAAITLQTPSNKISNAKVNHIVELKSPVYYAAASAGAMATVKPVSLKSSMLLADNQPSASSSVNTNFSTSQPASAATDAVGPTIADASNFSITGLDVGIIGLGPSKTTPPTLVGNGPGAFLTPGTSQSVGNERAYSATVANFGAQSLSLFAGNSRFSSLQENSADVALDYSNTNYLNSNYYGAVRTDENIMGGQSLSAGLLIKQQTPLKRLSILADVSYLPTVTTFNVPGPNVTELVGNGPGAFLTSVPSIIAATNITHSVNYGIGGEYKLTEANSIFGSFADVYGKDFYSAGYKFESGSDLFGLRVDYTSGSDPIPSAYVAGKTFMGKVSYSPSTSELSGFGEYALWGTVIPSFETSQPLGRDLEAPVGTVFGSDLTFASRKPAWVDLEPAQRFAVGVSGSISDDLNGSGMQSYYADVAAKLKISKRVEVGIDAFTSKDTGINGVHDQQEGFGGEVQYNFGKVQAGIGGGVTSEGGFIEAMLRF